MHGPGGTDRFVRQVVTNDPELDVDPVVALVELEPEPDDGAWPMGPSPSASPAPPGPPGMPMPTEVAVTVEPLSVPKTATLLPTLTSAIDAEVTPTSR